MTRNHEHCYPCRETVLALLNYLLKSIFERVLIFVLVTLCPYEYICLASCRKQLKLCAEGCSPRLLMEHLSTGEICSLNKEILICVYRLISEYTWLLQQYQCRLVWGLVCCGFFCGFFFFIYLNGSSGGIIYFRS